MRDVNCCLEVMTRLEKRCVFDDCRLSWWAELRIHVDIKQQADFGKSLNIHTFSVLKDIFQFISDVLKSIISLGDQHFQHFQSSESGSESFNSTPDYSGPAVIAPTIHQSDVVDHSLMISGIGTSSLYGPTDIFSVGHPSKAATSYASLSSNLPSDLDPFDMSNFLGESWTLCCSIYS